MKKLVLFLIVPFILAGTITVLHEASADAARLGGGRSFGSSPSYNRSAPSPSRQMSPSQQRQNGMQNTAAPAPRAPGIRGFLGPLLAGSLLGALIFGGGFAGVGIADFVLIALVVFMLSRLLRRRPAATAQAGAAGMSGDMGGMEGDARMARNPEGDPWARLRSNPVTQPAGNDPEAEPGLLLPEDFDLQDFISGAKAMFTRLQKSWDKRDLEDLSIFVTPDMMAHFNRQSEEDPTPSQTDIFLINARLVDFRHEGKSETASVFFEVLLREHSQEAPHEITEIWHFMREEDGDGMWRLDGLQQVQ